jgi:superfamily II DNA or RNA helicase
MLRRRRARKRSELFTTSPIAGFAVGSTSGMSDAQKALEAIRAQRDNPNLPVPAAWNPQYTLRKYQRVGVSHLLVMQRFVLGHMTGAGKTVMGLNAWGILREKRQSRLLIVAPKSAVSQWCEECNRFLPTVPCTEVPPSEEAPARERERYYKEWIQTGMGSMLALNWSQYLRDWDFFEETQDLWKEGTWVILDECQRVRNPKAKVYKVTQKLSDIVPRIHGFTATIIKDKAHDAFHILNLLSPGVMSLAFFNRKYVVWGKKRVPARTGKGGGRRFITVKTVEGYQDLQGFAQRMAPLYLAPPESEMDLERPSVQTVNRRESMSLVHRRIYSDAEHGLFLENCESDATAANSALTHAQIAASSPEHFVDVSLPLEVDVHPLVFDPSMFNRPEYRETQSKNTKLAMLLELLDTELEDEPVIVYSPFSTSITHLSRALQDRNPLMITGAVSKDGRDKARLDFQAGKSNLIMITDAGGEALNLQRAKHVIFYSLPWSVGSYIQVVGRARRFGSVHKYLGVWHLLMKDSVDELVESILQPKAIQFEAMLNCAGQITGFNESMPVAVARKMRQLRISR